MRNLRRGKLAVIAMVILGACVAAHGESASTKKLAVPTDLKEATTLVMSVYGTDIAAAKTTEQKLALAKKMVMAAHDEKDPAGKYVLYTKARELALAAEDAFAVCQVIGEMGAEFEINIHKQRLEALTALARKLTANEDRLKFLVFVGQSIESAMKGEDFENARGLANLHNQIARLTLNDAKVKESAALAADIRDAEPAYAEFKKYANVLETSPSDAEANFRVGRYLCFYKNDWVKGLPNLVLGNNAALQKVAEEEIKGVTTADDKVKLANQWWQISITLSTRSKFFVQIHAAKIYGEAMPQLPAGLARTQIEKRIVEVKVMISEKTASIGKEFGSANGFAFSVIGKWEIGISFGGTGPVGIITLNADHTAANSWRVAVQGKWEIVDNEVRIEWKDGWTDVIRVNGKEFVKSGYKPGTTVADTPFDTYKAAKQK